MLNFVYNSRTMRSLLVMGLALTTVTACKKAEEAPPVIPAPAPAPAPAVASVTGIETGRHIGANKQVSDITSVFGVRDTMYVAVSSNNTPNGGAMTAKWTFQDGQVVDSVMQVVANTDATNTTTVTEFHLAKATAWPVGKYTVDVMLDGKSVGSKTLEVKK